MAALRNPALSHIIGSIYDCAIAPAKWQSTLAEIAAALSCESIILSLNDLRHDRALINESVGWDARWLDERQRHMAEIAGVLSYWFTQDPPEDKQYVASREFGPGCAGISAYVRYCLQPLGVVDTVHFFPLRTPQLFSELVMCRLQRHGIMTDRDISLGQLLLPHLRRAITITDMLEVRTVACARMAETLDALRYGVVLINAKGAILH